MHYIAFDSHKKYTIVSVQSTDGRTVKEDRIEHERGSIRRFLGDYDPGSPVAVETLGNWYWIIDEIEAAGMKPQLVHARKAKLMMGMINKTDKLDARGLNRLQRTGTLPTVWIPPGELRDQRDLPRTRMILVDERRRLKNRIHATLAKYGLKVEGVSDAFGKTGLELMEGLVAQLPVHTQFATRQMLEQLAVVRQQIDEFEQRIQETFESTKELALLRTLPGVGLILGSVILLETGDVTRFPNAGCYASYAGTTPRIHASGGKMRIGQLRPDVNRYLKWAFIEAANVISLQRKRWSGRHVAELYNRIRQRRGHQKAIGAVARHLAEATYWMLKKGEAYRAPQRQAVSSHELVSADNFGAH
jgi:transposase